MLSFCVGFWKPREIQNPDYFKDEFPLNSLAPIVALAVEVWTTNAGIHFDNFVVSHSEKEVEKFTGSTFRLKSAAEGKKESNEKKAKRDQDFKEKMENGNLGEKVKVFTVFIADYMTENPMVLLISVALIVIPFFYLLMFGGKQIKQPRRVEQVEEHHLTSNVIAESPNTYTSDTSSKKDN
jgi:hypothetical protein